MRRAAVVLLAVLPGCELVFPPDHGSTGERCTVGNKFSTGTVVPITGSHSVEAARFNADQTVAYFSLCENGDKNQCQLYSSPFSAETNEFIAPAPLGGLNTTDVYDSYPTIAPDGQHILFGSERADPGNVVNVWVATAVNGLFDAPTFDQLALPLGAMHSNEPYLLGDGTTLYYSAYDVISNDWKIWRATGGPPDFAAELAVVGSVDSAFDELGAVVTDDELEIFFGSTRRDPAMGIDALDIWTASRPSTDVGFSEPFPAETISSAVIDWPVWISPDACELYYIKKPTATDALGVLYHTER